MKKILNEEVIKEFIKDENVFNGFIELFYYCRQTVPETVCDIRDNLIGVKIEGERLRFYFNKLNNGKWYISIKDVKKEQFDYNKLDLYKKSIDKVNKNFEKYPNKNKLKNPQSINTFRSEHIITNNGKLQIKLFNLDIKDVDNILKEIEYLKGENIKKVNLTIMEKE